MAYDPQAVAQKWANRLGASTADIQKGVQSVQVAPTTQAANRQQAYVDGVTRAANSGKWARGLNRVTLQQWQAAMVQKGLPRVGPGAQAAIPKMVSFGQQFGPYLDGLKQLLSTMPRGDINANKARAMAAIDYLSKFQRQQ